MKIDGKAIAQAIMKSKSDASPLGHPTAADYGQEVHHYPDDASLRSHVMQCLEAKDYESAISALQSRKSK